MVVMMRELIAIILFNIILFGTVAAESSQDEPERVEPTAGKLLKEAEEFTAKFDRQLEQEGWDDQVRLWDSELDRADAYIAGEQYVDTQTRAFFQTISEIGLKVLDSAKPVQIKLAAAERLLTALGEAPQLNDSSEVDANADKRAFYTQEISEQRSRLSYVDLTQTRGKALAGSLSALLRTELLDRLFQRGPIPFSTVILSRAKDEFSAALLRLMSWKQGNIKPLILPVSIIIILSVLAGLLVRSVILRKWGRSRDISNPAYSRRVVAAIAGGTARGLVPALIIAGLWSASINSTLQVDATFGLLSNSFLLSLLIFIVLAAFSHAFLSPGRPEWRLTSLSSGSSEYLGWGVLVLLILIAVDLFIRKTVSELQSSTALFSTYGLFTVCLQGLSILWILSDRSWQSRKDRLSGGLLGIIFRRSIMLLVFVAAGATLLGYVEFGVYLISRVIRSGIVLAIGFGLRGIIVEIFRAITLMQVLRQSFQIRIITLQRIRVWSTGLIDLSILSLLVFIILRIWDVPREDIQRWLSELAVGFTVGSITISPAHIASAIMVFFVVMGVTHFVQRSLLTRVLPQVIGSRDVQHSVGGVVRYLGLIFAVALSFAALGTDFSNIALVAGALSVGIGFGLQNIVNNFVSGIILLFERPIKVGDWILADGKEGIVQSINFRATELETFDRASILIPNASLLAHSVTNLTLNDTSGRVDIKIGVAYGTDPVLVDSLLTACAESHPQVLDKPVPYVLFQDFGTDSLDFELRCYTSHVEDKLSIASDLRFQIERIFRDNEVEIPFPQRVVHLPGATLKVDPTK